MSLSQKQLQNVCLLTCGKSTKTCRYLQEDPRTWEWNCVKLKQSAKDQRDKIVKDYLDECQKQGIDPANRGVFLGDNCHGYPILKNITQGFDCP